jgi:hypothetical protein
MVCANSGESSRNPPVRTGSPARAHCRRLWPVDCVAPRGASTAACTWRCRVGEGDYPVGHSGRAAPTLVRLVGQVAPGWLTAHRRPTTARLHAAMPERHRVYPHRSQRPWRVAQRAEEVAGGADMLVLLVGACVRLAVGAAHRRAGGSCLHGRRPNGARRGLAYAVHNVSSAGGACRLG